MDASVCTQRNARHTGWNAGRKNARYSLPSLSRTLIRVAIAAGLFEFLELVLGFFLVDAVKFLQPAEELLGVALELRHIVIGELAPGLLYFAFELCPVAFDLILIHNQLHLKFY